MNPAMPGADPTGTALAPATPRTWGWPGAGTALLLAVLAFAARLLLVAGSGASLHVDEAQYWDWSRQLQWGYYSKPPLIAALIALSTQLFGDSVVGLRALPMLCHALTALVLSALAADTARGTPWARRAGIWAAAVWLASPVSMLLGLVATTDSPLLLCWALSLAGLWWAGVRRQPLGWLLLALASGAGLLAKYSHAALVAGAALWALAQAVAEPRRATRLLAGVGAATAGALLLWLPNLLWNQDAGWPTWRHTAEITVAATAATGSGATGWQALLAACLAQAAVLGPALLAVLLWRLAADRRGRAARPAADTARPATLAAPLAALWPLLGWTSLPLALAGAWQAWRGTAQLNWVAPLHLAACVALAVLLAAAPARWRRRAAVALALQVAVLGLLVIGPALAQRQGWPWPPALDPWARMRGWPQAFAQLEPWLRDQPGLLLVGSSRVVVAQAGYQLRALAPARAAWQVEPGPAHHHYALACRWQPGPQTGPVLLLSEGPPPAPGAGMALQTLARAPLRQRGGQTLALWLSRLQAPAPSPNGAPAAQDVCR